MIRPAKFSDIPAILSLMAEGYQRSKYRDIDTIDRREANALLMNAVQRHGLRREGGSCVFVSDGVDGFITGLVDRLYHVGTKLVAQDVFFYVRPGAAPQIAPGLLSAYVEWASSIRDVVVIRNGITDLISDPEKIEQFYRAAGFERCGVMMERKTA